MYLGLYKCLISAAFPLLKATYIKKRRQQGKEHAGRFNERLGIYAYPRPVGHLYWFHGASVGEAVSMLPLIDKLLKEDPTLSILVTTGTVTSAEIMAKRLPPRAFHQFVPFDVPAFARRLLKHFKPDAVLWFESELWPSMLSEVHKAHIPLILVNGRISDKSFATWKKFKPVIKEMLSCFNLCLGQSEQDARRLAVLGAPKTACVGNIKFSAVPLPVNQAAKAEIEVQINGRPLFLISSTHHNEEEQLAEHFALLQDNVPGVLILIVPRHPNRGKEIAAMLERKGFVTALRSANQPITAETQVYVADTIGEMGLWYALSPACFVGGSLIPHGGQNFIEPARDKNAVIVGPYMQNFAEMMAHARFADALVQLSSAADVIETAIEFFKDADYLKERQEKAFLWAEAEAKVLDGIVDALHQELKNENA